MALALAFAAADSELDKTVEATETEEALKVAVQALQAGHFNETVVLLEEFVNGPASQTKPTAMYITATALQNAGREEDALAMTLRAAAEFETFFEGANVRDTAICYEMAAQTLARLHRWKELNADERAHGCCFVDVLTAAAG